MFILSFKVSTCFTPYQCNLYTLYYIHTIHLDFSSSSKGERLTEGPFRIDPNSGIITLVGQLDKSKVMYKLNITATDNGRCCGGKTSRSSRGLVVVEVKDINNNAPRFPNCADYKPSVLEREDVGTAVIRVRDFSQTFWVFFVTVI